MNHEAPSLPAVPVHVDERNLETDAYDVEDLRHLRGRALRDQAQLRAVLEHLRHARALAVALRPGAMLLTLNELEVRAREDVVETARRVAELDENLAAATPASRWRMALKAG